MGLYEGSGLYRPVPAVHCRRMNWWHRLQSVMFLSLIEKVTSPGYGNHRLKEALKKLLVGEFGIVARRVVLSLGPVGPTFNSHARKGVVAIVFLDGPLLWQSR